MEQRINIATGEDFPLLLQLVIPDDYTPDNQAQTEGINPPEDSPQCLQ